MRILKRIYYGFKSIYLLILNKQVGQLDYQDEYDRIASTYHLWLEKMHRFTDEIIHLEFFKDKLSASVLDFACGTGYITQQLLSNLSNSKISITAIDISEKMIKEAKKKVLDPRCNFIVQDGLEFLQNEQNDFYDAIFCGFALPYFNKKEVIPHFSRILKNGGTLHLILNCKGTLEGIYEIFMRLMKDHPRVLRKFLNIKTQLPKDEETFQLLFKRYDFDTFGINTINEIASFSTPEDLYLWLKQTGAIAGTGKIFTENEFIEKQIINKIRESFYYEGEYRINHKFILGVFKKKKRIEI